MNIEKNRRVIAKEGGIEVILDCLRNALSNPSVLIAASWSLRNIAVDGIILFSFFFFLNKFSNSLEKKKKTSIKKLLLKKMESIYLQNVWKVIQKIWHFNHKYV